MNIAPARAARRQKAAGHGQTPDSMQHLRAAVKYNTVSNDGKQTAWVALAVRDDRWRVYGNLIALLSSMTACSYTHTHVTTWTHDSTRP